MECAQNCSQGCSISSMSGVRCSAKGEEGISGFTTKHCVRFVAVRQRQEVHQVKQAGCACSNDSWHAVAD